MRGFFRLTALTPRRHRVTGLHNPVNFTLLATRYDRKSFPEIGCTSTYLRQSKALPIRGCNIVEGSLVTGRQNTAFNCLHYCLGCMVREATRSDTRILLHILKCNKILGFQNSITINNVAALSVSIRIT